MGTTKTADDYLEAGKNFCQAGQFDDAIRELEAATLLDSQKADAYYYWGLALKARARRGHLNQFIAAAYKFQRAFDLDNTNEAALFEQGFCFFMASELDKSRAVFEQYINANFSLKYRALLFIGNCLRRLNDFDQAIVYENKAVLLAPPEEDAYTNIGITISFIQPQEKAFEKVDQLHLPPDKEVLVLDSYGHSLIARDAFEEALAAYRRAAVIQTPTKNINLQIGRCLMYLKKKEEAIDYFGKVIALDENDADVYSDMGWALSQFSELSPALKKIAELSLSPARTHQLLLYWGENLVSLKAFAHAIDVYTNAMAYTGDKVPLYRKIASCHLELKDAKKATSFLQTAILIDDSDNENYVLLGRVLAKSGSFEEANTAVSQLTLPGKMKPVVLSAWAADLKYNRQFNEAIALYGKVLELNPVWKDIQYNIGDCLYKLNRPREAMGYFEKACQADPASELALRAWADTLFDTRNYKLAIQRYEEYLNKGFYDKVGSLNLIGLAWQFQKKYEKAIEYFDKVILLEPDQHQWLRNKAYAISLNGDASRSVRLFDKIVKDFPKVREVYFDYGNLLLDLKLYNEAITTYQKGLDIDKNYAFASHNIAHIYEKTGRFADARSKWADTAELYNQTKQQFLQTNDSSYYLYLAAIQYQYLKNRDLAEEILKEGLALFPEHIELLYEFAQLSKESKEQLALSDQPGQRKNTAEKSNQKLNSCQIYLWECYRKATRILNNDLKLNDSEYSNRKLGEFHLLAGDIDAAIASLSKAVSFGEDTVESFTSLGVAQLKNGNYPEAIRNFKKGLLINPEDLNLQTNLAEAYLKSKSFPEADKLYQQVYAISPTYQEALLGLGELYKILGDGALERKSTAEAEEFFTRARDFFSDSLGLNTKADASRVLTPVEISSVNYSLGYINAKLYEAQSDHPVQLLRDSVNNFSRVNAGDSNFYKANISIAKITPILNKKSLIVSEKASSVIIVSLAVLIFLAAQVCFFIGRPMSHVSYTTRPQMVDSLMAKYAPADSLKPMWKKLVGLQSENKGELAAAIAKAAPAGMKEEDVQAMVNKAMEIKITDLQQIGEGAYAMISFGALIFIIAGLVLKQLSKLKVGTIELEKSTIETASTSSSLNIR